MKKLVFSRPVNKTAALVVSPGFHYQPDKIVRTADQDTPISTRPLPKNAPDLVGFRFGRFSVVGLAESIKGRWVVRCDCGTYSLRTAKAINNEKNKTDMCESCRHLAYLQRDRPRHRKTKENHERNLRDKP